MIHLLELIAVNRIVEEEREVGDEIQVVRQPERRDLRQRRLGSVLPLAGDRVA